MNFAVLPPEAAAATDAICQLLPDASGGDLGRAAVI
jgi:hypothetical protein